MAKYLLCCGTCFERKEEITPKEEGQVISCPSVDEWKRHFEEGVESGKLVVADFKASWCGPCHSIAPTFAEIARKTPQVIFLQVDVDELRTVAEEFKVEAMPTFLFVKEGKEVDRLVGAKKKPLADKVTQHA